MFQNDNVTTDLTYGLVNDLGFEDTGNINTYIYIFLNTFRIVV